MGQYRKHCTKNGTLKQERNNREVYQVVFYRSAPGREWLKQLDPDNDSVTLKTLQNAASTIGAHLEMKLVFDKEAA